MSGAAGAVRAGASKGVDRRAMGVLSGGHLFTDVNQGAVAALLPLLVAERGISLAAAGALLLASTISSSVVQPLFGYFSDGRSLPALMPVGLLLAGGGIALVGVAPGYPLIFACVVVSGIGVAAFHPEAARFANYVSGSRRATGMSFFSVGGNAGMALGPVLATPAVLLLGMPGTLLLFIPAAVMSAALFWDLPRLIGFRTASEGGYEESAEHSSGEREAWRPFAVMVGVVTLRSVVYFGLILLVAQYYTSVLDAPVSVGNAALSVMLFAGAAGTLLAGPLADRFGRRTVLAASMIVLGPLLLAFSFSGVVAGFVLIALIGAAIIGTFGTTVVMGQEYLPGRIGLAAGITMGFSIGLGGLGSPLVGAIADGVGVKAALLVLAALPIAGLVLTLSLPRAKRRSS
ncbi:MAG: MFS transporter [Rubrobacter sp.]|nr:MFS transporter [Rubrobacter sp.]